jgi:hypothetical protein
LFAGGQSIKQTGVVVAFAALHAEPKIRRRPNPGRSSLSKSPNSAALRWGLPFALGTWLCLRPVLRRALCNHIDGALETRPCN